MHDSGLRVFPELKAMQHSDAAMPCVIDTGFPSSFIRLSVVRLAKYLFFPFPLRVPLSALLAAPWVFVELYSILGVYAMWYCTRVSYLLANLRQWFSRYTCSPEGNFKILGIKFRDTSPADRSLRSRALIGLGLMARDTLLFESSLIVVCHFYIMVAHLPNGRHWI